jgi:hypothetical protein
LLIHCILRPARLHFCIFFCISLYCSYIYHSQFLHNKCIDYNCLLKITIKSSILDLYIYITVANWHGRGVGHGIKQNCKYLWYPLFQSQWDRCDKKNHQTYNYLVTGHHLHKGMWHLRVWLACFRFSADRPV